MSTGKVLQKLLVPGVHMHIKKLKQQSSVEE